LDTTSAVPPTLRVAGVAEGKEPDLDLRVGEVAPSLNRERVLACAPDTDQVFFKVPKVMER
jgi:aspartyl-tRNA(Asn)/glutamyl-tRNA(Gln) amidotransferase subunit C